MVGFTVTKAVGCVVRMQDGILVGSLLGFTDGNVVAVLVGL